MYCDGQTGWMANGLTRDSGDLGYIWKFYLPVNFLIESLLLRVKDEPDQNSNPDPWTKLKLSWQQ